uniref:Uncharacterized protein n=1 Tax=Bubo bubo TaxID=30461 RepID=A0A8C0FAD6_BUBBB
NQVNYLSKCTVVVVKDYDLLTLLGACVLQVLYKEDLGTGIPTPVTPEIERVKRNQEHISSVLYKEGLGTGIPTPVTPEMERVKRNQENISSVLLNKTNPTLSNANQLPLTPPY